MREYTGTLRFPGTSCFSTSSSVSHRSYSVCSLMFSSSAAAAAAAASATRGADGWQHRGTRSSVARRYLRREKQARPFKRSPAPESAVCTKPQAESILVASLHPRRLSRVKKKKHEASGEVELETTEIRKAGSGRQQITASSFSPKQQDDRNTVSP